MPASRVREDDLNKRLVAMQQASSSGGSPRLPDVMKQMVETQKAILEATKKPDKKLTLIDNRGLAKPSNYSGDTHFLQWKIRLEAFVCSIHPDMEVSMAWAEEEPEPISEAKIRGRVQRRCPGRAGDRGH